ncbi:hypothetical protein E2542_SST17965 [Spatholobus suberectus]|nr:hypothetical protein E2542_SST17965 [Spatholobus suberectus]
MGLTNSSGISKGPPMVATDPNFNDENQIHNDNKENVEEQEFSFACIDPQGMLIFVDEIFDNRKIRPTFPIFNQLFLPPHMTTTPYLFNHH